MKISQGQNRREHLSLPSLCILKLGISRSVSIAPEISRIMFSPPLLIVQNRGVARGRSWGARENAKTPWQYLGRKSRCWKAHFFKICFFVKYFRQRLLSLVNMGLHAAIIRLNPLIHEREQRWVASVTSPLKNPGYAPAKSSIWKRIGPDSWTKWPKPPWRIIVIYILISFFSLSIEIVRHFHLSLSNNFIATFSIYIILWFLS